MSSLPIVPEDQVLIYDAHEVGKSKAPFVKNVPVPIPEFNIDNDVLEENHAHCRVTR